MINPSEGWRCFAFAPGWELIPVKAILYRGKHYEGGPLARMTINGYYNGGIFNHGSNRVSILRSTFNSRASKQNGWNNLEPGPAPLKQKVLVKNQAIFTTDAMRGALLHSAYIKDNKIEKYDIITSQLGIFRRKTLLVGRGPAETALVGTQISSPELKYVIPGRIIRSFDPCLSCATHLLDYHTNSIDQIVY